MSLTNAQNTLLTLKDRIAFFKALTQDEVLSVTKNVKFVRDMKKGEKIFEQGDYSKELYFVVKGLVDIQISKKEKSETTWISVAKLPKKALIGEMAFITGEPRSARACADEDGTSILSFDIIDNPDAKQVYTLANIYLYFAKDMAEKLKNTSAKYAKVKSSSDIPYDDILTKFVHIVESVQEKSTNKFVLNIPPEIIKEIDDLLKEVDDEDTKKEVIKTALIEAFKLRDKDVIIMTKSKLVIRLFQDEAANEVKGKIEKEKALQEATKQKVPAKKAAKDVAPTTKEEEFLLTIISDTNEFARKILKESIEENIEKKIADIARDIFEKTEYKKILNFHYMKNYDKFSILNFAKPLSIKIWFMLKNYILDELKKDPSYFDKIYTQKESQTLVLRFTKKIIANYRVALGKIVAKSFLDCIGDLENPVSHDGVIESIIQGTAKHQSILLGADGLPVATKLQQIWMRTQQAIKRRDADTKQIRADLEMYTRQVEGFENSIRALHRAKHLKPEDVAEWNHEKLRDIVINENDEFKEEKRLLQYIPTGAITDELRNRSEKGIVAARSEIAKEEYERAHKFMEVIHSNNTEKNLDFKLEDLYTEKDKKERLSESLKNELEHEMSKGLEEYDQALSKMHEAVVFNIVRTINRKY